MSRLESGHNHGTELPPVEFVQMQFQLTAFCEEFGGVFQEAVIIRFSLKSRQQFDTDNCCSDIHAFKVNQVPDQAHFLGADGWRVKSVPASVLVAGLGATLSLFHSDTIAHLCYDGQGLFVVDGKK